jgi:hypothetical protein
MALHSETNYVGSSPAIGMFIFWICFKLTNTELNRAAAHRLFKDTFKSSLCPIGKARNAVDADISVILPQFIVY